MDAVAPVLLVGVFFVFLRNYHLGKATGLFIVKRQQPRGRIGRCRLRPDLEAGIAQWPSVSFALEGDSWAGLGGLKICHPKSLTFQRSKIDP